MQKVCCWIWICVIASTISAQEREDLVKRNITKEDMPRIPFTAPEHALSTFTLAAGFQLEMVASEPMVSDPVDACFDEHGRMFVAEMHGYPFSHEPTRLNPDGGGMKNAGIIRMLEDTDGDGVMDKSVVFADDFSWPTSICCYDGGVYVIAPGHLYYFKDTDGDNKADIRRSVLTGFGRGNVQALSNGLIWGLDNRIYFAAGRNPAELTSATGQMLNARGGDLRFDPRKEIFEPIAGGLQFGHSKDNWGVRFVCSNSNHIQQVVYPRSYLGRNPGFAASGMIRSIASDGASARVFRKSPPEPWRIIRQKWRAADKGYYLVINKDGGWEFIPMDKSKKAGVVPTEYPVGFFTSATGITVYRGSAWDDQFHGNAFVGDVGGNLVHRKTVNTDRAVYSSTRADKGQEILASTDNWFRPVNFVNAPDGTLYILDMYRETIEHPYSIPEDIKKFLDLTSGHDRGRIYRLVSPGTKRLPVVSLGNMSSRQLVEQLNSANAWNRDTAQRMLFQRQAVDVAPLVERLFTASNNPLGRLHALYTLQALDALKPETIVAGLQDPHHRVRAHAVKLSEPFLKAGSIDLSLLEPLGRDTNDHVRFQLAFSLGETESPAAGRILAELAASPQSSPEVLTAVYSSCRTHAPVVLRSILHNTKAAGTPAGRNAIRQLALMMGASADPGPARAALRAALEAGNGASLGSVVADLGTGLARRGAKLTDLVAGDANRELAAAVANAFQKAAATATDNDASASARVAAAGILAWDRTQSARHALEELLTSSNPPSVQLAAVSAFGQHPIKKAASVLLESWTTMSPAVRRETINQLQTTSTGLNAILTSVESQDIQPRDLERTFKQQLLSHRDPKIKARSAKLLGAAVETNRTQVVKDYQKVLELDGDVLRGRAVFEKTCSVCHRVNGIGHAVAPDLVSVKNKSEADLLIAILDPNREAQPNFNTYNVITNQGKTFSGIIAVESATSITLRRAESREDVVLRSNIDEMSATGRSLMPEGLEKDLRPQQLADVIAFVRSIGQPQK